MKPIYEPKGKAKEYGDYAINIYTGCPHRCYYCFAPNVLRRDKEAFHGHVEPRLGLVEAVKKQIEKDGITGKLIHLCFTCDPYPTGYDSSATREIIKILKETGNHVQILTKGDGCLDFDLLDENDWYGITYSGYPRETWMKPPISEPGSCCPLKRLACLEEAYRSGIKTWISFEPVLDDNDVLELLRYLPWYISRVKIGKLNYHPSDIDWAEFGRKAESICKAQGIEYYIKDSLRKEMEKNNAT